MKVKCEVKIYEVDDLECPVSDSRSVSVESHWSDSDMVVLQIESGQMVSIVGKDLLLAIENCLNVRR